MLLYLVICHFWCRRSVLANISYRREGIDQFIFEMNRRIGVIAASRVRYMTSDFTIRASGSDGNLSVGGRDGHWRGGRDGHWRGGRDANLSDGGSDGILRVGGSDNLMVGGRDDHWRGGRDANLSDGGSDGILRVSERGGNWFVGRRDA